LTFILHDGLILLYICALQVCHDDDDDDDDDDMAGHGLSQHASVSGQDVVADDPSVMLYSRSSQDSSTARPRLHDDTVLNSLPCQDTPAQHLHVPDDRQVNE